MDWRYDRSLPSTITTFLLFFTIQPPQSKFSQQSLSLPKVLPIHFPFLFFAFFLHKFQHQLTLSSLCQSPRKNSYIINYKSLQKLKIPSISLRCSCAAAGECPLHPKVLDHPCCCTTVSRCILHSQILQLLPCSSNIYHLASGTLILLIVIRRQPGPRTDTH